jgi:hypothetical protein
VTASHGTCIDGVWHERRARQWHCRGEQGEWVEWRSEGDWYSTGLLCGAVEESLAMRTDTPGVYVAVDGPGGRDVLDFWLFDGRQRAWMLDDGEKATIGADQEPVAEPAIERAAASGHRFPTYALEARCVDGSLHIRRLRLVRAAKAPSPGAWTAVAPWHDTGQSCSGLAARQATARRAAELLSSSPEPLAIREFEFPRELWRAPGAPGDTARWASAAR